MEIGVMIVADADAVAVACANELVLNPIITAAASTTLLMFFIFYVFWIVLFWINCFGLFCFFDTGHFKFLCARCCFFVLLIIILISYS
jgi:hypothetical protein